MMPRWLTRAPRLHTAYLGATNHGRAAKRRRSVALTLVAVFISVVLVGTQHEFAAAALAWLAAHSWTSGGLCGGVACVLVSRRRAQERTESARAWTRALPVEPSIERWQALLIQTTPALVMACILSALLSMAAVSRFPVGAPALLSLWAATIIAIVAGTLTSYCLPTPTIEALPEGSRYVPYRRRARPPLPAGSLSALGLWPMRRMFASARPKSVAHATLPILLGMPLGSSAATAILIIGVLAVVGALVLLVTAVIKVSTQAARWLQPLPLESKRLAREIIVPSLAIMLFASALGSWLSWVMGTSMARSLAGGTLSFVASSLVAVCGALSACFRAAEGHR